MKRSTMHLQFDASQSRQIPGMEAQAETIDQHMTEVGKDGWRVGWMSLYKGPAGETFAGIACVAPPPESLGPPQAMILAKMATEAAMGLLSVSGVQVIPVVVQRPAGGGGGKSGGGTH